MNLEGKGRAVYQSPKPGLSSVKLVGNEMFLGQNFPPKSDYGGSLTRITLP